MSTFEERLKEENNNLIDKIEKLKNFINSSNFSNIDIKQQILLNIQIQAMNTYRVCLQERIEHLD